MKPEENNDDGTFNYLIEDIQGYYENNEGETSGEAEKSILKDEAPPIRRIRSKYSNGVRILEIVAGLIEVASKYSLKIHSDTNEVSDFRKHKGSYSTIYYMIKPMFGRLATTSVENLEKTYEKIIKIYANNSTEKHHEVLKLIAKKYEQKVNHAMMIAKVSFETEKLGSGPVARSRILS